MTGPITDRIRAAHAEGPRLQPSGPIATIAGQYDPRHPRLLGFLLKLSFDEMTVVTNDVFKANCGGVPRNSFVVVKLSRERAVHTQAALSSQLILARVTDAVPTPIDTELQQTVFQVHKLQATIDAFTNRDLQWGAMKASVIGTFYDEVSEGRPTIAFGTDVASFFAAHSYEVYAPTDEHLQRLLNSFVEQGSRYTIGHLKYTETPPANPAPPIPIDIDLDDFIGRNDAANRTALFGKTRSGKSNTVKIVADGILRSPRRVAQLIFDPSGEYTYINEQDGTSLYALHRERCVRYSLRPRDLPNEQALGLTRPQSLRVNFYETPSVGVSLIQATFSDEFPNPPNYIRPFLDWVPTDPANAPGKAQDARAFCRDWRTMGLWYAVLQRAEYPVPRARPDRLISSTMMVEVPLRQPIKQQLAQRSDVQQVARIRNGEIDDSQPLTALPIIYEAVYHLKQIQANQVHFPPSTTTGEPYFTQLDEFCLRVLADRNISGVQYLRPFRRFHDVDGTNIEAEIVAHLDAGRTVFIDYANAPEDTYAVLSSRIARAVLNHMQDLFATNSLGDRFVIMFFEEAHRLFRADDKDLTGVYNRLAKEGAKFHVGMVYATQSITTLSPDLRKNTENYVIAHLNDDREISELAKRYEFRDVSDDVMRSKQRGYVRLITESHRFVLPVQVRRFGGPSWAANNGAPTAPDDAAGGRGA
jgi:hypothetical protein